jgi:acetoin utilization deacetylase AcuC-like enzyme
MIEMPERVSVAFEHLRQEGLVDRCRLCEARAATDEELLRVHRPEHLAQVAERSSQRCAVNGNIYYSADANRAARMACGAVIDATLRALEGGPGRAFALVRPPGHHAGRDGFEGGFAEGGCFYNSVAVAAACARAAGVSRVFILDYDVHHGNGTQEIFYADASVLFVSIHADLYPGTGAVGETGEAGTPAAGRNVNLMWPDPLRYPPASDAEYLAAVELLVLPILRAFDPGLVLVSSGFDAARGEAFRLGLAPETFGRMMAAVIRGISPAVPVIAALEGGYNPTSVAGCCSAVLRALLGDPLPAAPVPSSWLNTKCEKALLRAVGVHQRAWAPHLCEAAVAEQLATMRRSVAERASEGQGGERKRRRRQV